MKYLHVLLACASVAIVSAIPLGNSQEASLVARGDNVDMLPYRRALDSNMGDALDISVRGLDDELELAARDFEDADELSQRDVDDALERRLLDWLHKIKGNRATMQAEKYQAKADRQFKAAGVTPPGGDSGA